MMRKVMISVTQATAGMSSLLLSPGASRRSRRSGPRRRRLPRRCGRSSASSSGVSSSAPISATPPARMSSDAPRMRSSAASTRLSERDQHRHHHQQQDGVADPPQDHRRSPQLAVGLVGQEEPAQHAGQRHPHRAAGRWPGRSPTARRADLVGRQTPVDRVDALLHGAGEVAHEDGGDVGDHAAPVLGGGAGQLQVLGDRRPWCRAPAGVSCAVIFMRGLAAALLVGAGTRRRRSAWRRRRAP